MKLVRQLGFVLLIGCAGAAFRACAPKAEFDSSNNQVAELQAENGRLKAELKTKSALPVDVSFRRAYAAAGYVAVLNTTVKSPLAVLLTKTSAALGTVNSFELHLDPDVSTELGGLDGAVFEVGDTVKIENLNYTPMTFTITAPD